ncbi:cupin domain-containing protein [Parasphingorhabdus sp.]|uniref:cupin domain-containing protein n=1 Tax=Parasphingorhabdus sp. TaxID=2709688 RepID=UPI003266D69C
MSSNRIVTGHDADGKSVFLDDQAVEPVQMNAMPGFKTFELWSMGSDKSVPHKGAFPGVPTYFPGEDGTVFRMIDFPPTEEGESGIDLSPEGVEEISGKMPGALAHFELDAPGMHTTDSIDFGILVKGELLLELDDGATRTLKAGDCVVQNGTRHAWRNHSGTVATMFFILQGAKRDGS